MLINQVLLACLFDQSGNRGSHTNHGVVTCAECVSDIEKAIQSYAEENQESQKKFVFYIKG